MALPHFSMLQSRTLIKIVQRESSRLLFLVTLVVASLVFYCRQLACCVIILIYMTHLILTLLRVASQCEPLCDKNTTL